MTHAQIINGKEIAAQLRGALGQQVAQFQTNHGVTPGLAVVLVGEDPASQVYVRNKHKQTQAAGMNSFEHKLPDTTSEAALLKLIDQLNGDEAVHGILVQLPLPKAIDEDKVLQAIDPAKDVDGFHPVNVGKLSLDVEGLRPCTPEGSVMLAKSVGDDLTGKHVVVVGRSNIVGKPVAQLFLQENCTVTIVHSRTRNIEEITKQADILVAAVGVPQMIKADWLKQGAIVIDVGINRIAGEGGKNRLVGDVDFDDALSVAGAITPVPGGVGPMTIACLLRNTLLAAYQQKGLPVPNGV